MNDQTQPNGNGSQALQPTIVREVGPAIREIDPLAIIEKRNKMLEKVLEYAIRSTRSDQWTNMQGKPWPTAAAAEVMARRCAVKIANVRTLKVPSSDEKGDFYFYQVEGTASLPGEWDSVESIGTCSSRDSFLGTETQAGRAISDIDEGNILKAAYSNFIVNAVCRLLGVRNMTWERLADFGVTLDGAQSVTFKAGAQGGGSKSGEGADIEIKFGAAKGKTIGQLSDAELVAYLAIFEKELKDPEKAKFHKFTEKKVAAIKKLQADRANKGAGVETPAAGHPSIWQRICAMADDLGFERGQDNADLIAFLKKATNNKPGKDLNDDDFKVIHKAMSERVKEMSADVPY